MSQSPDQSTDQSTDSDNRVARTYGRTNGDLVVPLTSCLSESNARESNPILIAFIHPLAEEAS